MTRETGARSAGSQITAAQRDQDQSTARTEVLARIRFAERLALRSAIGLDGLDRGDVLIAIAETLAIAERWAVAS